MEKNVLVKKLYVNTDYGVKTAFVYANFEKETVTAVLKNCSHNAIVGISKKMQIDLWSPARYRMNETYSGTEVCQKPDIFDVEIGANLAIKKVVDNYNRAYHKKMKKFVKDTAKCFNMEISNF